MNPATTTKADYYKVRMGRRQIRVHKDFLRYDSEGLCENERFDGVRGPFRKLSSSDFAGVFDCKIAFWGRRMELCLKHYFYRSTWDFIKHLFRPSRAMRAFKASLMLEENGLGCPAVVAVGDFRYGLIYAKTFLITRKLQKAKSIDVFIRDFGDLKKQCTLKEKRDFFSSLGSTIGRMHASGIFHGDLRPGNVFAELDGDEWKFFFLDNERTRKFWRLPRRRRLKNLVQINMVIDGISYTDRMRFFKKYMAENAGLAGRRETLAAEVLSRTEKRLRGKTGVTESRQRQ